MGEFWLLTALVGLGFLALLGVTVWISRALAGPESPGTSPEDRSPLLTTADRAGRPLAPQETRAGTPMGAGAVRRMELVGRPGRFLIVPGSCPDDVAGFWQVEADGPPGCLLLIAFAVGRMTRASTRARRPDN